MVWGFSFPLIPSLLRCLRQAIGKRGRMYLWIYHVPIIIFEEIIRLSYYSGESFLWNGLRLFSTIGKGVIFDGYYICLNMEGRKR